MIRQIIHIDEEKCNGCGLCASACHEGAIDIVDGKAKLVRENFCDGFGDCLPNCPTGAITFENREAPEYDEAAVEAARKAKEMEQNREDEHRMKGEVQMSTEMAFAGVGAGETQHTTHEQIGDGSSGMFGHGCPGSRFMQFDRKENDAQENTPSVTGTVRPVSRLNQWPCQIKLLPTKAPFYQGAKLLIAADCTAYAYAGMHEDFMKGRITMIGCPKLDDVDYTDKLTEIISANDIKSVTIVRMEVPCCGGLQKAAEDALRNSGRFIPWRVVTITRDGKILDE